MIYDMDPESKNTKQCRKKWLDKMKRCYEDWGTSLLKRKVLGSIIQKSLGVIQVGGYTKVKLKKWNYKVQNLNCSSKFFSKTCNWLPWYILSNDGWSNFLLSIRYDNHKKFLYLFNGCGHCSEIYLKDWI